MSAIIIGLIVYLVITFLISLLVSYKVKGSSKNFLIAGGTLPFLFVIFAQIEQAIDGNATLGLFNLARDFGFWSALAIPLGLGISLILAGLLFAKPLREKKILTIGDYFRVKFGKEVEYIAAILMILSFSILLAGNLAAVGKIVENIFGVSFVYAVILSFIFIFIYTYIGGFISDVVTDPIQVITFIIGVVGALFWIIKDFGINAFASETAYSLTQFTSSSSGAVINWATILALGLGDIIAVDFIARLLAAKSTKDAQKGCLIGGIGTIIIGGLFALFGIGTLVLSDGSSELFEILRNNFPVVIVILFLGAVITASFSTADGALLGPASLLARNIFHKKAKKIRGYDHLLKYTRFFIILMGIFGVFIALKIPQPGILLTLAFDVVLCSLFACFALGTFWLANKRAAIYSIIIGGSLRLLFFIFTPTIFGVPNTLLYIKNNIFTESFDGWATIIPFIISLFVYIFITILLRNKNQLALSNT